MFKLIFLVAVIAAAKTDFIEDKLINTNWKIIALSPSLIKQDKIPENCSLGINITLIYGAVHCICGSVKGHVVNMGSSKGQGIKALLVPVESREDLHAIREVTCNCPVGIKIDDVTRMYVKELDTDILIAIDEVNKLNYLIAAKSTPSRAELQDLIKAADVINREPKENWIVTCSEPSN